MKCDQYLEQAFSRSTGTGERAENADSLSDHMLNCQDCLSASDALTHFHNRIVLTAPRSFVAGVLAKLEQGAGALELLECETTEEELSAFLDGELSPEREEQVIVHLADCDDCTGVLSDLKGLSGVLGRSFRQSLPIPGDFASSVTKAAFGDNEAQPTKIAAPAIDGPQQPLRIGPRRPSTAWLSTAAAVLITGLLSFQFFNDEAPKLSLDKRSKLNQTANDSPSAKNIGPLNAAMKTNSGQAPASPREGKQKRPVGKKIIRFEKKSELDDQDFEAKPSTFAVNFGSAVDSVLCFNVGDMDQGRGDVVSLLQSHQSIWQQDNDSESWDLELSGEECRSLLIKLKRQPNLQLAFLSLNPATQSQFSKRQKNDKNKESEKTSKSYDPASDLKDLMKRRDSKKTSRVGKKKDAGRSKPVTKTNPKGMPKPGPAASQEAPSKGASKGSLANPLAFKAIDKITLRSGWTLSGRILKESEREISMQSAGRVLHIERKKIKKLSRGRSLNSDRNNRYKQVAKRRYRVRLLLQRPEKNANLKRALRKK